MKDAVATMGDVLPEDAGGRDAVHVAVISAVAAETLKPGQHVGFTAVKAPNGEPFAMTNTEKMLGIVDPFIKRPVRPEERFWLYVYPRSITGLSHLWSHPDIPDERPQVVGGIYNTPAQKLTSEQWLRNFLRDHDGCSYELLLKAAETDDAVYEDDDRYVGACIDEDYFRVFGNDASGEIPTEFWLHVEIVTGKPMTRRPEYFSCSC
jgi:hypothetical protein